AHAVVVPPVRSGPRMIVREVVPRRTVLAVILPNRAPRTLGQVGAPRAPRQLTGVGLRQAQVLHAVSHPHISIIVTVTATLRLSPSRPIVPENWRSSNGYRASPGVRLPGLRERRRGLHPGVAAA